MNCVGKRPKPSSKMKKREWRFFALHWENGPEVCNAFEFGTKEDKKKLNLVLKKFKDYRTPRKSTSFERFKFWNRSEQEGETIYQFVTELQRMIKNFEYTASTVTMPLGRKGSSVRVN